MSDAGPFFHEVLFSVLDHIGQKSIQEQLSLILRNAIGR